MNLQRLYIQNYKQFREPVELLPPEGAIGVVGSNGAGKSTLFESILWAFFGSRGGGPRFANESIPWSGGSTKDPSVVEVTLAAGGGSYTVRRQLKSGSTSAEALDESGRSIVSGSADVGRWVEESLLHMDRTAFEATFYARQKELEFFAHDDGISRVRRISQMLGISSVEAAQKLLREDRNDFRAESRMIEGHLAEADLEGLQNELEEARTVCRRLETALEKVSNEYEEAQEKLETARKSRSKLDTAYREHSRLAGELQRAEGDKRRAEDRAAEAEKDLAELTAAGEELDHLKPEVSRLPELSKELERLDEDRRKTEQRDRDRRERRLAQARVATIESEVFSNLEQLDSDGGEDEPLPGWWTLFDLDGPELLEEAAAVLGGASEELKRAEEGYEKLRELAAEHEALRQATEEEAGARERHDEAGREMKRLSEEVEDISGGEDLEEAELELRREEEKLREVAATHRGRAASAEREAKNVDKARESIDSGEEEHCPTCHRGFEAGEQLEISDTLKRQAASIRRRAAHETEEAEKLASSADATKEKLQAVSGKLGRWREVRVALSRASDRAADRLESLEEVRTRRGKLEESLSGSAPTREELEEDRARCERLRGLRDARPGVVSLGREHGDLVRRVAELASEIEKLSGISYDPDGHREKREEQARLERARGRVEELERRLTSRPEVEKALEEAREKIKAADVAAGEFREGTSALGFDEAAYKEAGERVSVAEEQASGLRDAREQLGGEWKDSDYRIERVTTELKRLDSDRKLANKKASEAARMDEMDKLFTEFFRSLTSRARPMLEAEASALVRDLTDSRYERMEFDDNYRVRLLDRFDDAYPIERFSGGESDVASLSARVALSKIIAARGGATLGFLVLDEVFGSLDAGRRNNVLLALERLKGAFGQIFIISHVAEVQESALVDEVWMLQEDEEGKSTIQRDSRAPGEISSLLQGSEA